MTNTAFKENCPDVRNTRVVDMVRALRGYHLVVDVYDPCIDTADAQRLYEIPCTTQLPPLDTYSAVIIAVTHDEFAALGEVSIRAFCRRPGVTFDVKSLLPLGSSDGPL